MHTSFYCGLRLTLCYKELEYGYGTVVVGWEWKGVGWVLNGHSLSGSCIGTSCKKESSRPNMELKEQRLGLSFEKKACHLTQWYICRDIAQESKNTETSTMKEYK